MILLFSMARELQSFHFSIEAAGAVVSFWRYFRCHCELCGLGAQLTLLWILTTQAQQQIKQFHEIYFLISSTISRTEGNSCFMYVKGVSKGFQ